jgi:uncharacterized protein
MALAEEIRIPSSDGADLEGFLARPPASHVPLPGVLLLHGFPSGAVWAEHIGADLPELATRIADEMGFAALALRFRGCGTSTGDFSLGGWIADVRAALTRFRSIAPLRGIWICGFGTGGTVGLVAGATDRGVAGVAMAGSPADFRDWAENDARLLAHAHQVGVIRTASYPPDLARWSAEFRSINAVTAAEELSPRSLFLLHGADDDVVPQIDARLLADAHGAGELRILPGAGHQLRHDPRAIAILLGWLGRSSSEIF